MQIGKGSIKQTEVNRTEYFELSAFNGFKIYEFHFDPYVFNFIETASFVQLSYELLWNDRGVYVVGDISVMDADRQLVKNIFPSQNGSGVNGKISKCDTWTARTRCMYSCEGVKIWDRVVRIFVQAKVDNPRQCREDWYVFLDEFPFIDFSKWIQTTSNKHPYLDYCKISSLCLSVVDKILKNNRDRIYFLTEIENDLKSIFIQNRLLATRLKWENAISYTIDCLYSRMRGKNKSTMRPPQETIDQYVVKDRILKSGINFYTADVFDENYKFLYKPRKVSVLIRFLINNHKAFDLHNRTEIWYACLTQFDERVSFANIQRNVYRISDEMNFCMEEKTEKLSKL